MLEEPQREGKKSDFWPSQFHFCCGNNLIVTQLFNITGKRNAPQKAASKNSISFSANKTGTQCCRPCRDNRILD